MMNFTETRNVKLPQGGTLEIQLTEALLERIRYQFALGSAAYVDDDHLRMFIHGAIRGALDKVETEEHNG